MTIERIITTNNDVNECLETAIDKALNEMRKNWIATCERKFGKEWKHIAVSDGFYDMMVGCSFDDALKNSQFIPKFFDNGEFYDTGLLVDASELPTE